MKLDITSVDIIFTEKKSAIRATQESIQIWGGHLVCCAQLAKFRGTVILRVPLAQQGKNHTQLKHTASCARKARRLRLAVKVAPHATQENTLVLPTEYAMIVPLVNIRQHGVQHAPSVPLVLQHLLPARHVHYVQLASFRRRDLVRALTARSAPPTTCKAQQTALHVHSARTPTRPGALHAGAAPRENKSRTETAQRAAKHARQAQPAQTRGLCVIHMHTAGTPLHP